MIDATWTAYLLIGIACLEAFTMDKGEKTWKRMAQNWQLAVLWPVIFFIKRE